MHSLSGRYSIWTQFNCSGHKLAKCMLPIHYERAWLTYWYLSAMALCLRCVACTLQVCAPSRQIHCFTRNVHLSWQSRYMRCSSFALIMAYLWTQNVSVIEMKQEVGLWLDRGQSEPRPSGYLLVMPPIMPLISKSKVKCRPVVWPCVLQIQKWTIAIQWGSILLIACSFFTFLTRKFTFYARTRVVHYNGDVSHNLKVGSVVNSMHPHMKDTLKSIHCLNVLHAQCCDISSINKMK